MRGSRSQGTGRDLHPPPLWGRDGEGGARRAQPAHKAVSAHLRGNALKLRRRSTEPEIRFWHAVRAHRFHGLGFRRQVPLAGYIVDFVCHDRKLVVEIDGGSHTLSAVADAARTARLAGEGYRVERFWNHDVMDNLDGVLERLTEVLGLGVPPSLPSPTRGEGKNASSSSPAPTTGRATLHVVRKAWSV